MTQLSLLDAIREGEALKLQGMQTAVDHANAVAPNWSGRVWSLFVTWLSSKPTGYRFQTEDFRRYVEQSGRIEKPPSNRAYGFLGGKAAKEKLIVKVGYEPVINPKAHQAPCAVWQKL